MPLHDSSSLVVSDPEIDEVLNLETGEILPVAEAIGDDIERAYRLRMALRQGIAAGKPLFACPLCTVPVHIVSLAQERKFYFRHEVEDGRCPAKTKGNLPERAILAMKYDGARESAAHKRMKGIIAESLRHDRDFSDVEIEPVWKGVEANTRRYPDVRALWKGTLKVAFEVQLSTTFLRVIAERREFYLRNGGLLLWVFKGFDPRDSRITQDDIFYNNNRNAFVANDETLSTSREFGALVLNCAWSEPSFKDGILTWAMQEKCVRFSELTIEREMQRVFFFDADAARECVEAEVRDGRLRMDFRKYWLERTGIHNDAAWVSLRRRFLERGIRLPRWPNERKALVALLDSLYSAREGRPVGWSFADLAKIAHHVFDRYKGHLWAFRLMLSAHDRGAQIVAGDTTRKWRNEKVFIYKKAWAEGDSEFSPDRTFDDLVVFLFPEIAEDLRKEPH